MQKIRKIKSDIVKKSYDVDDVQYAEFNLDPLVCKYCGSYEVTYNQGVGDAYCSECGEWQDNDEDDYINKPKSDHENEQYADLYGDEVMDMLRKKKSIRKGQNVWYRKWIWVVDKVYKDRFGNVVCDIYMPGDPDVTEEGIQLSELSKRKKIKTDDLGRNTYGEPEKFSIRKKSNFPKCPECGSSTSYGGDIGYICSNLDCDNIFKKPKEEKETKKESMKKISISNQSVIQMFLEDSYPHSKEEAKSMGIRNFKTSYGTENLKITQMNGDEWALVNYYTPIVINDNGTFIFNTRKYSVSTSRIQNMIEGVADSLGINLVKKEGSGYGRDALGMKSIRKIKSLLFKKIMGKRLQAI